MNIYIWTIILYCHDNEYNELIKSITKLPNLLRPKILKIFTFNYFTWNKKVLRVQFIQYSWVNDNSVKKYKRNKINRDILTVPEGDVMNNVAYH